MNNAISNMIIGLGNCGHQIVKAVANSSRLKNCLKMYCIDSQTASVDINSINNIKYIPIISDEKAGSGRNRERGKAMYEFHEEDGAFDEMYDDAVNAKSPVLVVTSSAGGTGSGSAVPVCRALIKRGVFVVPIIVCPSMEDPDAYHLNTNDLMIELSEVGVETYSIFRNNAGDVDYAPINNEVVNMIEIILGKRYEKTDKDSIDDSDLDVILSTPGRFIATSVTSSDVNRLKHELAHKVFSGCQPAWTDEEVRSQTFVVAHALTSMFASQDYKTAFSEISARMPASFDEYRNIVDRDNNGLVEASIIVAGLPRGEVKKIDGEYNTVSGIGDGMKHSTRPGFMNRKKATTTEVPSDSNDGKVMRKFKWR